MSTTKKGSALSSSVHHQKQPRWLEPHASCQPGSKWMDHHRCCPGRPPDSREDCWSQYRCWLQPSLTSPRAICSAPAPHTGVCTAAKSNSTNLCHYCFCCGNHMPLHVEKHPLRTFSVRKHLHRSVLIRSVMDFTT